MTKTTQRFLGGALVLVAGLAALRGFDGPHHLLAAVEWGRGAGAMGVLAFAVLFVVATVLMLPASVLTLAAGFVWGPLVGLLIVLPSAVLASTVAFWLSRSVGRKWVEGRVRASPRFRAIDEAVGGGGLRLVLLLRLSPLVPFNVLNPTLGLTKVSARDFVVGSIIGMAPGALLYLYLGSLVTSASELLSGARPTAGPVGTVLYVVGLVATVVVMVWVTSAARAALAKALVGGEGRGLGK
jgi:uncharacterized membrane protein YdjX (TVP38/TMEM64 family)